MRYPHGALIFQAAIHLLARAGVLALAATSGNAQPASKWHDPMGLATPSHAKVADFGHSHASPQARSIATWVLESGDSQGLPFVIVDKIQATAFVFDASGQLRSAAPVLIGSAIGDGSAPGVGQKKLSDIRPDERTTPAGRFVASLDRNLHGKEILWVDYDTAISLHPVVTNNTHEKRAQRLATPTALDNRISYGCINVSAEFFATVIKPAFANSSGVVYILPETLPLQPFFKTYRQPGP